MTDSVGASALANLQQENAQLRQDNRALLEKLEDALARVNQLQFNIAHDLRNPLRHVSAFVQVIQEDHGAQLPAEVLAHLCTIHDAAKKMNLILDAQQRA